MSDLLSDYDPKLVRHSYDESINPQFAEDPPHLFSFVGPTCGKYRIEVGVRRNHHEGYWRVAGELPEISIHPSIWHHTHVEWNGEKGTFTQIPCEWHRCIYKGRFIDQLFAWPVEDPANAKFG